MFEVQRIKLAFTLAFIIGFLFLVVGSSSEALAQSLSISPNRITFEGRKNKDRILVSNPSSKKRSYRAQLLKRRMLEDGKYVDVKEGEELADELFANKLVRFSPRSFSLDPKSSQTIRLRLRKPRDLPDGEYRSHMRIQLLPETTSPSISEKGRVNISIQVNYGITIPIIVRKGNISYDVSVDSIGVSKNEQTGKYFLRTQFKRSGKRSSYGDISVVFTDNNGKEYLLKFLPGLSLFYPNNARTFNIPLDTPKDLVLSKGILKVIYREQEAEGGKVIAEGTKSL